MQYVFLIVLLALRVSDSQTVMDQSCEIPGVGSGKCVSVQQCHSAFEALTKGIYPKMCGFDGHDPIVCCANANANAKLLSMKAIEKCEQYKREMKHRFANNTREKFSRRRGRQQDSLPGLTHAVGGTNAFINEFPHMAALGYGDANNIQWQCGGSLISETFVLTAAHCLQANELGHVQHVLLGYIVLTGTTWGPNRYFTVIRRIPHPSYRPPSVYDDVGLLQLNKPVTFSRSVKPACLYIQPEETYPKQPIFATGWGLTEFGGSPSTILQKVDLEFFTLNECRKMYKPNNRRMVNGIQSERQMCVGGRNVEKDTCHGDSGGPIQFSTSEPNDLYEIIGVTSFGKACGVANVPGVYTKISYYVPWIESIVWP